MLRVLFSSLGIVLSSCAQPPPEVRLAQLEASLERDFPAIRQVAPEELASRLTDQARGLDEAGPHRMVLFDAREPEEFAVSRLPGAIRIDPGARAEDVLLALKSAGAGACPQAVFYCSVGVRSSVLAERARGALEAAGCPQPENLRGGVFAWHNQQRLLENARGPTDFVHPYDRRWGRLLTRQNEVRLAGAEK